MTALHHGVQPLARHVGIDLGRLDVGVPQHLLHHTQVRAPFQPFWRSSARVATSRFEPNMLRDHSGAAHQMEAAGMFAEWAFRAA